MRGLLLAGVVMADRPVRAQDSGLVRTTQDGTRAIPSASRREEARARFTRGLDLFADSDFGGALVEFRRAYAISPEYRVLFNIGQVCYQLQDYPCALKALQQYVTDGATELSSERRLAVESDISRLRTRVATVAIRSNVAGAAVSVDETPVGLTPLTEPVLVKVGTRKVTATLSGRPTVVRTVSVAGEDHLVVELDFASAGPVPSRASSNVSTVPAAEPPPAGRPVWPLWVGAAGLAMGAVVTGAFAFAAAKEVANERDTYGASRNEIDAARSRGQGLAVTSDLLTGAAVLCGGVGLYLTLRGTGRADQPPTRTASSAGRDAAITVGPGFLRLRANF